MVSPSAQISVILWFIALGMNLCWFESLMSHMGTFPLKHIKVYLKDYETSQACDRSHTVEVYRDSFDKELIEEVWAILM